MSGVGCGDIKVNKRFANNIKTLVDT